MKRETKWTPYLCGIGLAVSLAIVGGSSTAFAGDEYDGHKGRHHYSYDRHDRSHHDKYKHRKHKHRYSRRHHHDNYVIHRRHGYHHRVIARPYSHRYSGHVHGDSDAHKWRAFTLITLKILDNLNEQQKREHEAAQVRAATAPIGERIIWHNGRASGAITPMREGTSTTGRYCREYLQEVTIGGRTKQVYGTACRQPDSSWAVIASETM